MSGRTQNTKTLLDLIGGSALIPKRYNAWILEPIIKFSWKTFQLGLLSKGCIVFHSEVYSANVEQHHAKPLPNVFLPGG